MSRQIPIKQLLFNMGQYGASDLHLKVGLPPIFRIKGILKPLDLPPLTAGETDAMVGEIIPPGLKERFDSSGDLDFSTHLDTQSIAEKAFKSLQDESQQKNVAPHPEELGVDRFRCNIFRAEGAVHAAIRRINSKIPSFESLGLPPIYQKIADEAPDGLVLVVGVTGCGKSTTLACMVQRLNETRAKHIITIEDPIEFHFEPAKSVISQRELGIDCQSYAAALRYVVRQDPDVIFIGELRDHDTVLAALQAAETGHLVFASMHTADTAQSMARLLEFFPQDEHDFIRSTLSKSLRAVCAQRLLPATPEHGVGIVPATEVLLANSTVREIVREGRDGSIYSAIAAGKGEGMRSYTDSLVELVEAEHVTVQTAMEYAPNRDALRSRLKGVEVKDSQLVR
ncbi:MAG: type IV pilus twitching motility protein PilT [Planctomycetota bacterium]